MTKEITVRLKPGRDKSAKRFHPWIFSGAIARVNGAPEPGAIAVVLDSKGGFVARGYFNAHSQIQVRLLTWDEGERVDDSWWGKRLDEAVARRTSLDLDRETSAFRLVNAEADLLPGLIVDRYGEYLVIQALTAGAQKIKPVLVDHLVASLRPKGIFERSEARALKLEGLQTSSGILYGTEPPLLVEIKEGGFRFLVNLKGGQKTGFFLDQRVNRRAVARYAAGRSVLDCFAHTGAFSVYSGGGGAESVMRVEVSEDAHVLGLENLKLNGLEHLDRDSVLGDAFEVLRELRDRGRKFDLILLDPPKFAHTRSALERAARGYKDINLLSLKLLNPGGVLATFSCSGAVSSGFFEDILAAAATDAGRPVQIIERLSNAPDHPVLLSFPESNYLKGVICRVF